MTLAVFLIAVIVLAVILAICTCINFYFISTTARAMEGILQRLENMISKRGRGI